MRLIYFYVKDFRVLHNVGVDFTRNRDRNQSEEEQSNNQEVKKDIISDIQQGYSLDFLVGVNGTGKSTLMRLLARIFAQLLTPNYTFPVGFELEYQIHTKDGEHLVRVSNLNEDVEIWDGLQPFTWSERQSDKEDWSDPKETKIRTELLPKNIVIYTTGGEEIWLKDLFGEAGDSVRFSESDEASEAIRLQELPGHKQFEPVDEEILNIKANDPFLFIKTSRLPLVALCGILAAIKQNKREQGNPLKEVFEAIGLSGMTGFSLRLRAFPDLTLPVQMEAIDDLIAVADREIRQGSDILLIFDIAQQLKKFSDRNSGGNPNSIFDIFGEPIELFQQIHILYEHQDFYDPPLQEVNIFLQPEKKEKADEDKTEPEEPMLLLFDWLSDGERSFLARMALFALFRSDNLLIMLDEPEVHFNDVWKREIVNILDRIMGTSEEDKNRAPSHALITTHSSIALTDVRSEDILVLHKQDELLEGQDAISPPNIITLGADPSDILVHVFGSRSSTGKRSINYIRQKIGNSQTAAELEALKDVVAHGYWRYRIELEAKRLTS